MKNEFQVAVTMPLGFAVHRQETAETYSSIYSQIADIFFSTLGYELQPSYFISDNQRAIYSSASSHFKTNDVLSCSFHNSKIIKNDFIAKGFKANLDAENDKIKILFHTIKNFEYLKYEVFLSLIDFTKNEISKTQFTRLKRDNPKIQKLLLDILANLKKKSFTKSFPFLQLVQSHYLR